MADARASRRCDARARCRRLNCRRRVHGCVYVAADAADVAPPDSATIEGLESWHHDLWTRRRAAHVAEAAEIARFRRDSLEASHRARVAILEEQLAAASEDRIRRMRAGQLARANADRGEALEGLVAAERRADIIPRRVASGTLRVEH